MSGSDSKTGTERKPQFTYDRRPAAVISHGVVVTRAEARETADWSAVK